MRADLNEAQQRAVEHGEGPLLVLAGAGTGKTRVLTHRVAQLIRVRHVPPARVMAVTFTRKAAEEMKARLAGLFGDGVDVRDVRIGTFHALSASLLRETQGGKPMGELVPEAAQLDLLKEIMAKQGLTGPAWHPLEVLRRISLAKGRVLAADAPELAQDPAFATVYGTSARYCTTKDARSPAAALGRRMKSCQVIPLKTARASLRRLKLPDEPT